jgi:nitrate/TMAO reductase-like tetraheme cytochrome c subunit
MKLPEMSRRTQILLLLAAIVVIAVPSMFLYDYTQNNPQFCLTCHLMNTAYDAWSASAMHNVTCHDCHETNMIESLGHVTDVLFHNPTNVTKMTVIDNSLCESCHDTNDPQWLQIADTAGHKVHIFGNITGINCTDCHGLNLHVFEPPENACLQCHDVNLTNANTLMGTHCISCHDFIAVNDTSGLIPGRDDCITCHPQEALMGPSIPDGGHNDTACTDCHNPHLDTIFPDCSSCHQPTGTIHDVHSGNDCTTCHTPHSDETLSDNCLSCHTDKTDHNAGISCETCHS